MTRRKRAAHATAGVLVVLTIAVGLPINVVSDYFPSTVTDHQMVWITGLVAVTAIAVYLTWLARRIAERRMRGKLFQVQPMPKGWVPRNELDAVVRALTGPGSRTVGVTTALWGAGGFGKTSLAVAACHDRRVRRFFSGGIVWATIGQDRTDTENADVIRGICETLSAEVPQMTDLKQLSHHLAELMAERGRMLLVVDDVWTGVQLEPFLAVSQQSRLLVTTRRPRTLPDGATKVNVDAMTPTVAARLLGRNLPVIQTDLRRQLLEVTGGWPLLLALANARLVEDVNQGAQVNAASKQAIARLRQAGPTALDITDSGQRETTVKATIDYSLEALHTEKRERFLELGIFAEDVDVPLDVVALLWQGTASLTSEQSQRLCEELAGLSLVSLRWEEGRQRVVALHDVVRDFIRSKDGLGPEQMTQANRALINKAAELVAADEGRIGDWWRLPDGHFLWDQLVYHLAEGGLEAALNVLITDVRWVLARLAKSGALALEADLTFSQDPGAVKTRRLVAQVGHLLSDLESGELSEGNRLTHLIVLPNFQKQISELREKYGPFLLPAWPLPESRNSAVIRTLNGHFDTVATVKIAVDGKWLASAGDDRVVRLWNVDGSLRTVLEGHTSLVTEVAIAADGSWLASASGDRTVRLWNADGTQRAVLKGHTSWVNSVAIAADGSWLASGSHDGTVRLWNADGTQRAVLEGHTNEVHAVAIAADGSWLASGSYDHTIRLWNADGTQRAVLEGHTNEVNSVAIAADGSWLASGSHDGTVRLWNADGTQRAVLEGHTNEVHAVAIAADGSWLASGSYDHTIRLWNADGTQRAVLEGHTGPIVAVAISVDGAWLASGSADETVRLWEANSHVPAAAEGHTDWVNSVAIAADGSWLASGSHDGTVRLWNADGTQRAVLKGHTSWVNSVAIAADGSWLASGSHDGTVRLWNADGTQRAVLEGHTGPANEEMISTNDGQYLVLDRQADAVNSVAIAADGSWLASGSHDGTVRLWNADGTQRAVLEGHTGPANEEMISTNDGQYLVLDRQADAVNSVAIAADGSWLASGSHDGTVRLWNADGTQRAVLEGHTNWVHAVAIAADGSWLASASADETVRLWNADGTQRAVLEGHTNGVHAVAIAADGSWLASASADETVRLWNADGTQRAVLEGHTNWVRGVAIAADSSWLASASDDGTVRLWKADDANRCITVVRLIPSIWGAAIFDPDIVVACGFSGVYKFSISTPKNKSDYRHR
ncbi:NB-ARC domain-containing protein [Rhizohabitans arisaemae]|uniref:NB-ARC domain-containing protein n=2 Tax=Rhizohabitans arisaemae TaxID=2720610 RepID=UPI0024B284AD|nr:NB-ARC domain-containing protein [Rhizohabitans arisaemae]